MQYKIKLNGAVAVINSLGGEMVSYKDASGSEYVWNGDPAYWTGHAPVLFPVVGALIDDTVRFGGVPHSIRKHGFARKSEFKLDVAGSGWAAFTLVSNDEFRKQFPCDFKLTVTHRLTDSGFYTEYTVTNTGKEKMPFCIGGHAGFMCPMKPDESFEDYRLVFESEEKNPPLYTDAKSIIHEDYTQPVMQQGNVWPLKYSDFDPDVLIFRSCASREVQLKNDKTGSGLNFRFWGFENLGVWSAPHKNAPFLCLEPWKGLPAIEGETGEFTDKPGIAVLDPGASYRAGYRVSLK